MSKLKEILYKDAPLFYVIKEIAFKTKGIGLYLFLMLLMVIISRGFIGLNSILIAYALDGNISSSMNNNVGYILAAVGVGYFFVFYKIIESICYPIVMWLAQKIDTIVESAKVDTAFDLLMRLPIEEFKNINENELTFRLNVKKETRSFFYLIFRNLIPALIEIFIAYASLLFLNIYVETMVVIAASVTYLICMVVLVPFLTKAFLSHTETEGKITNSVLSLIELSKLVKVFGSQSIFIDKYKKELAFENRAFEDKVRGLAYAEIIPSLILAISMSAIFYIAYSKLESNEITVGVFSSTMAVCSTILFNMKHLVWVFGGLMNINNFISFPFNVIKEFSGKKIEESKESTFMPNGTLEVKNLNVTIDEKHILKNISFKLEPGEKLWLIGKSGSGKSTLLSVLAGFTDYTGEIYYNDKLITNEPIFGLVPQSSDVIIGSVKFNLLIGKQNATEEEMWKVLELVNLKQLLLEREGLNTLISEFSNLSGGEKQRLAIARAIISERPISIMDEPTSALDIMNEKEIIENIQKLPNSSIISIHRLHAIPRGSKILRLNNGEGTIEQFN